MRSRYTAFSLGDAAHLEATWFPANRPKDLVLDGAHHWDGLEISAVRGGGPGDATGTVTFRARWHDLATGERGALDERSLFRHRAGRWWYVAPADE